ncbi:MAG: type II toxin-antitoxin system HicB family antitoxin [Candidatus Muiribacteriaceae bacterium]
MKNEIIFLVEEDPEGGYTAKSLSESIYTQGDNIDELKKNIIDAIDCHFDDENKRPPIIRLHYVREEILKYA